MNQPTLIRNVLTINKEHVDVLIEDQFIKSIYPHIVDSTLEKDNKQSTQIKVIAGQGRLLSPPFVDAHFHLDATLSLGRPRLNESGTLFEGIQIWAEQKPLLSEDDVYNRAKTLIHWAIARGTLAMRTHVDIGDPKLRAVRALLKLRKEIETYFDLQIVAFPQDGYLRQANAESLLNDALDLGVDVVGGFSL